MDSIPQIIQGYSREHNFVVRQLELEACGAGGKSFHKKVKDIVHVKQMTAHLIVPKGTKVCMTLGGKHSVKEVYNLRQ